MENIFESTESFIVLRCFREHLKLKIIHKTFLDYIVEIVLCGRRRKELNKTGKRT
jgi:hypothetical protein